MQGVLVLLFLTLVAVVTLVDLPDRTALWREAQNSGHTPLFGVLALLILIYLRSAGLPGPRSFLTQYGWAFVIALATGAGVEVVQWVLHRDADVQDVVRDFAGISAFLIAGAAFDPAWRASLQRGIRTSLLLLGLVILAGAMTPLAHLSYTYVQRDRAFPLLVDFGAAWSYTFARGQSADVAPATPPAAWRNMAGHAVGILALYPGDYPGLVISEPAPDWSHYDYLEFSLYSPYSEAIAMELRINDQRHNNAYNDRYNLDLNITPGENLIRVPLQLVRMAPRGRQMDMQHIAEIILFYNKLQTPLMFYLGEIRLSRE